MAAAPYFIAKGRDVSSPFESPSISTWTSGRLGLVGVLAINTGVPIGSPSGLSLSGNGQGWSLEASISDTDDASIDWTFGVFSAHLSSPTTGVLALTGTDLTGWSYFAEEWDEMPASGAVVQAVAAEGNSDTMSATLLDFADDVNNPTVVFGGVAVIGTLPPINPGTGLTEIDSEQSDSEMVIGSAWRTGEDLTPELGLDGNVREWSLVALELSHSAGGGSLPPIPHYFNRTPHLKTRH